MRRFIAVLSTAALTGSMVASMMAGPASAAPSCKATAANPTAENSAIMKATGTGSCSGVNSVTVKVCLQAGAHTPAGLAWANWGTCNQKTPAPGTTASVADTNPCTAGHSYLVRTRTVSTGFNAAGSQVAQKVTLSSAGGVTRNCHN